MDLAESAAVAVAAAAAEHAVAPASVPVAAPWLVAGVSERILEWKCRVFLLRRRVVVGFGGFARALAFRRWVLEVWVWNLEEALLGVVGLLRS